MATYNRADRLKKTLPHYVSQRAVAEVIVVDDGGQDATRQVAEAFGERVRYLRSEARRGTSHAENVGVAAARGDFVFIGEDDLEPDEGHVATLLAHLGSTGTDIACGRRVNVYGGQSREEALARASRRPHPLVDEQNLLEHSFIEWEGDRRVPLASHCALIRREVFEEVRFDEAYKGGGWRQETDFQLSAGAKGYGILLCPHAVGFHYPKTFATGKKVGGARSGSRLGYEREVARHNYYMLVKHWDYLSDPAGPFGLRPSPEAVLVRQLLFRYRLGLRKARAFARARLRRESLDWN